MWLNEQITGTRLDTSALPDVSLRNLFLQFSQETDRELCLTRGLRFNAELWVGSNLPAPPSGADDVRGCRTSTRARAPGRAAATRRRRAVSRASTDASTTAA